MIGLRVPGGRRCESGQASVELVALVPVLFVCALGVLQLLAAGAAAELARHAAEAGAVALVQGRPASVAAREAVPGWSRRRMAVTVRGSRVRVRLRPPAPFRSLANLLTSTAEADAGASRP
jgi:Flp pilus assembly protein TadG